MAMFLMLIVTALPLRAHENTPSIIDMTVDGRALTLTIKTNVEALIAGTAKHDESGAEEEGAEEYLALRDLSASDLTERFIAFAPTYADGLTLALNDQPIPLERQSTNIPQTGDTAVARLSTITYSATLPGGSGMLSWRYAEPFGNSVLRFFTPTSENHPEPVLADYVAAGLTAEIDLATVAPQSLGVVVLDYIVAGFDHIIPKGLDHILFVIGLFLLSAHLRPLLMQVTMFTLAHTITLALGALGIVNIPGNIVEPLIAASIVFVAVENLFTEKLTPWRPFLIFAFGLLHGLGFASVLGDFGLPAGQFIPALIAFNIGVEIGQLTVIAACFFAVGLWFRNKDWYHRIIVIPASLAIAIMATYWLFERTGFIA